MQLTTKTIVDTAARLRTGSLAGADAKTIAPLVARELHVGDVQEIQSTLVAAWGKDNAVLGEAGKGVTGAAGLHFAPPVAHAVGVADVRAAGIPASALNAVVPLASGNVLTREQRAESIATIHNKWFSDNPTYQLGYRGSVPGQQHRPFYIPVFAVAGEIKLNLKNDEQKAFVETYAPDFVRKVSGAFAHEVEVTSFLKAVTGDHADVGPFMNALGLNPDDKGDKKLMAAFLAKLPDERRASLMWAHEYFVGKQSPEKAAAYREKNAARGYNEIAKEVVALNDGALTNAIKLVTAHLAGDFTRLAPATSYLEQVKGLPELTVPAVQQSSVEPSAENALHHIEDKIDLLDKFLAHLEKVAAEGDGPVLRESVPAYLRETWDMFDDEHNRWVKERLGWGETPTADWVETDKLPASRVKLDAAPIRAAYDALAAGLRSGVLKPSVLSALIPLADAKALNVDDKAEGIKAVHNGWFERNKGVYKLGEKQLDKGSRAFLLPVQVKGGKLDLVLNDDTRAFVVKHGYFLDATIKGDAAAFEHGRTALIAQIIQNNEPALLDGIAMVTAHLAGQIVRTDDTADYVERVKLIGAPAVPAAPGEQPSRKPAKAAVKKLISQVEELAVFLSEKGEAKVPRSSIPRRLRPAYDMFAEEHDRWVKTQAGYGGPPDELWVHTSKLPGWRIAQDADVLLGSLATLLGKLEKE